MAFVLRPPGSPLSLRERLGGLAHWQRVWSVAAGLLLATAFGAGTLALATGLDLAFTLSPLVRAFLLATGLVGTVALVASRVLKPWRVRSNPMAVAFTLESQNPELNDALASSVAFDGLPEDDAAAFREAALKRAEKLAEPLGWNSVLGLGKFWKAFWLAIAAGVALAAVMASNAIMMPAAFARLFDPWGEHAWPARTKIELNPYAERIALGDAWSAGFRVSGRIPESAHVQIRTNTFAFEEAVSLNDAAGTVALDASRTASDFEFRIFANDAETPWRKVIVAPPPRLVPPLKLRAIYPAYTGWQPLDLPEGTVSVEAVNGTRFVLHAITDRPIAKAVLVCQNDPQAIAVAQACAPLATLPNAFAAMKAAELAEQFTREIPLNVADRRLSLDVIPPQSGVYALRFTDDTGLTGQRLLDFRGFNDPAPTVTLLRPDAMRDTLDLLIGGSFPLEARSDDRTFAVKTLAVEYRYGEEAWQVKPLADLESQASLLPALTGAPVPFAMSHPPTLSRSERFALAKFLHADGRAPGPGDLLAIRAISHDWDDVSLLKAPGQSPVVTIRIHSPESLEAELQRGLAALREPLKAAGESQSLAAEKAKAANLEASAKAQAEVRARVADPRDGLRAKLDRLQAMRRDNNLPATPTTARLDAAARDVAKLDEKQLPAIDSAFDAAKASAAALPDLAKKQDAAAKDLKAAAEDLDRWAGLAELQSDANSVAGALRKSKEALDALRGKIPAGVSPEQLPPEQRAALEKAAGDLAAAEDALKRLNAKAEKVREAKAESKPEAEKLGKAMGAMGGTAATDDLRKAADDARGNRMAEAAAGRGRAEDRVKGFEDALAGRDKVETPDELRKKAKDRSEAIDALKKQQDELAKRMKEGGDRTAMAEEQAKLARETAKLAEKAAGEKATESAESLKRAAEKMEQAAEANGDDAARAAKEAADELAKARELAQPKPEQSQAQLAREQQEELLKTLKVFRDRQQAAIDESERLSAASAKAGKWERPVIASLASLAEREAAIAKELDAWAAKSVKDAPVFEKLLAQAGERIALAASRLRERKDDALSATEFVPETEAAADEVLRKPMREALRRMDAIIAALSEKPKGATAKVGEPMAGGEAPMPMNGGAQKPPPLAQLKALRDWQAEVRDQTQAFANAHPDPEKLTADERAELAGLQKAQAEIAAMFEQMKESLLPKAGVP